MDKENVAGGGYYSYIHHNPTQDGYEDIEYFGSYAKLKIHEEMLKDRRRTETYRKAIQQNSHLFKNKIIMDVGCGTGVLSFFAAKAGALRVYSIEASDMAHNTELIVEKNGLSHIIKVLHGKLEDLFQREAITERVDVIISEWMGSFLLFESMIETVIFARDNYLMPGGLVWPSSANIFISAVNMDLFYEERINFWKNVYDIDMSPLIPFAQEELFSKPIKDQIVDPKNLLSNHFCIKHIDIYTLTIEEISKFLVPIELIIAENSTFHGFVTWFDVRFENKFSPTNIMQTKDESHVDLVGEKDIVKMSEDSEREAVILSTSPFESPTHWKQDVFLIENPIQVSKNQTVSGVIRVNQHQTYRRHWWLELSFSIGSIHLYKQFLF